MKDMLDDEDSLNCYCASCAVNQPVKLNTTVGLLSANFNQIVNTEPSDSISRLDLDLDVAIHYKF